MSIRVENVTKIYGTQKALNNVSFTIEPGQIVGFLGPNGAGKSTMMKIITGYLPQTEGKVYVLDKELADQDQSHKKHIGYLPEHNPLYLDMYVWEFLNFAANVTQVVNKKERIAEVIKLVGLEKEQNKIIQSLSKGYRQRVGLAHALLHDPDVLILDEPTTGLDPNQIVEIRNLIKQIGQQKTVMLSTHIMQEVQAVCSRVIIINEGQIVADNPIDEIAQVNEKVKVIKVSFEQTVDVKHFKKVKGVRKLTEVGANQYEFETEVKLDVRPQLFEVAVANGYTIIELNAMERELEQVFHELTDKKK